MTDYKAMYFSLFNSVTDVLKILKLAQIEGEHSYMKTNNQSPKNSKKLPKLSL